MDYQAYVQESLASLTKSIRKDSRSVKNRVWSIFSDSEWVQQVGEAYNLPLVANERCGRWYIPPQKIAESVYFKSTDGHTTQWQFSTRRLNLHILETIRRNNGIVIVDSTRRGKRMPDALSKTIPTWCAVLTKAALDEDAFYTPPNAVSRSEHAQIEALLPQFVENFKQMELELKLDKPLRPIWVTPDSELVEDPEFNDFYPVVLCTASRMVQDGAEQRQGFVYVQGAADDHEEWAEALSPDILWHNADNLKELGTDSEIHDFIKSVESEDKAVHKPMTKIEPHQIWVGLQLGDQKFDRVIDLRENSTGPNACPIKTGKLGSKLLREKLPSLVDSVKPDQTIAVVCDTGSDFSIGVSLAIICKFTKSHNKQDIRKQLAHIIDQHKCNPSRTTLNAVNSYLMG